MCVKNVFDQKHTYSQCLILETKIYGIGQAHWDLWGLRMEICKILMFLILLIWTLFEFLATTKKLTQEHTPSKCTQARVRRSIFYPSFPLIKCSLVWLIDIGLWEGPNLLFLPTFACWRLGFSRSIGDVPKCCLWGLPSLASWLVLSIIW